MDRLSLTGPIVALMGNRGDIELTRQAIHIG